MESEATSRTIVTNLAAYTGKKLNRNFFKLSTVLKIYTRLLITSGEVNTIVVNYQ